MGCEGAEEVKAKAKCDSSFCRVIQDFAVRFDGGLELGDEGEREIRKRKGSQSD